MSGIMPLQSTLEDSEQKMNKHRKYYLKHRDLVIQKNSERNKRMRQMRREAGRLETATDVSNIPSACQAGMQYKDASVQTDAPTNFSVHAVSTFNDGSTNAHSLLMLKTKVPPAFRPLDALETEARKKNFTAYDHFVTTRQSVVAWGSLWGGISAWPETLEILFCRAVARGPERVEYFIQRICAHETKGSELLKALQINELFLPGDVKLVSILWDYQQEQVVEVVRGLTIIQTRVPIMRRSIFSVGPGQVLHDSVVNIFAQDSEDDILAKSDDDHCAVEEALALE